MGLYNIVFGTNPAAPLLLRTLGFEQPTQVGRFRDAFVSNGEIVVYTRNGGGNRACMNRSEIDCRAPECYGCVITHRLPKHPLYLRDRDDSFDTTYATVYFRMPDIPAAQYLLEGDIGAFDPTARWRAALDRMKRGELSAQEEAFGREIIERLKPK